MWKICLFLAWSSFETPNFKQLRSNTRHLMMNSQLEKSILVVHFSVFEIVKVSPVNCEFDVANDRMTLNAFAVPKQRSEKSLISWTK